MSKFSAEGKEIGSWCIGAQIGSGACGSVHELYKKSAKTKKGRRSASNESSDYVIKVAELPAKKASAKKKKSEKEIMANLLWFEYTNYNNILPLLRGKYIPETSYSDPPGYGSLNEQGFAFLVLERMEAPLPAIIPLLKNESHAGKVNIGTVFSRMLTCVEKIHECSRILVDVKSDNFMLAKPIKGEANVASRIRVLDFGLVDTFLMGRTAKENQYPNASLVGTPMYSSLNVMNGHTASRRDDLEALGYIFIELMLLFLDQKLPWYNSKSDEEIRKKKEQYILQPKEKESLFSIIKNNFGSSVSHALLKYFENVQSLDYAEAPNYKQLHKLLDPVQFELQSTSKSCRKTDRRKQGKEIDLSVEEEVEEEETEEEEKDSHKRNRRGKKSAKNLEENEVPVVRPTRNRKRKQNSTSLDENNYGNKSSKQEKNFKEAKYSQASLSVKIVDGPEKGTSFLLDSRSLTVGRDPASAVRTTRTKDLLNSLSINDMAMSTAHVMLTLQEKDGKLYIRVNDLYSTNGTFINDNKIRKGGHGDFCVGDELVLGQSTLMIVT